MPGRFAHQERPASQGLPRQLAYPHDAHGKEPGDQLPENKFRNKRNRITDTHRQWIEKRYHDGWAKGYADEHVKIFRREDFAYHKVKVVFWQTDENDQPAIITERYEKTFTAANVAREQAFYDSDLTFLINLKSEGGEKVVELALTPKDNASRKLKAALGDQPEILFVNGRTVTTCKMTNTFRTARTSKRS